jgi:CHAT domain-containing protein
MIDRTMIRSLNFPRAAMLLMLPLLAACAQQGGSTATGGPSSGAAGQTSAGEDCAWRSAGGAAAGGVYEIICGAWRDPSARITVGAALPAEALTQAATAGPWRDDLSARAICETVQPTRLLGEPAVALSCRRRNGGVPHYAVAVTVSGRTYYADGVAPAVPAIEATIAQLSGRAAPAAGGAEGAELLALAARGNFGSGDLARYQALMRVGAYNNIEENFPAAEDAYRDALALHQRLFGAENPEQTDALMHLALQVSNQGRFDEAGALFSRAQRLGAGVADPLVKARLEHYRAAHHANARQLAQAKAELDAAEAAYIAAEPRLAQVAAGADRPTGAAIHNVSRRNDPRHRQSIADQVATLDPSIQLAAYGLADVWRLRGLLAQRAGDCTLARSWATRAEALNEASGIDPGGARWRARRLAARASACEADFTLAAADAGTASRGLREAVGEKIPTARGLMDAGAYLDATDANEAALVRFRDGATIMRARQASATTETVFPYLDAIGEAMRRRPGDTPRLAEEMFNATQLIGGGATQAFIAQAAVRLGAGNERVRDLQEATSRLSELYIRRDSASAANATPEALAAIDAEIAALEARRGDIEASVQSTLPNYNQLVAAAIAKADDLAAVLRPNEGFLAIVLGPTHGHAVLLRQGKPATAWRVTLSRRQAEQRVAALRRGIEPTAEGTLPEFDMAAAHALYSDLMAPGQAALRDVKMLTISAGGALPFALLPTAPVPSTASGRGEAAYREAPWLLKEMALAYVPSPQSFLTLRRNARASAAPLPYAGFGGFTPAAPDAVRRAFAGQGCARDAATINALGPLPLSAPEVRLAGRSLGADSAVRLGPDFTRNAVVQGNLDRYRIVHFAAHALLPTELACLNQPAIIASAPGGDAKAALITAADVVGMRLDADLVVLSACNTAGPDGKSAGEAFSGLARAFFFAGTRGLIATHWAVADESTALLMLNTVLALGSPAGRAAGPEALRQQQLDMVTSAGQGETPARWAHPFYWAPFVFAGTSAGG